ncbi:unnamed protein product [Acanthoscelides obtectus]|uniref:Uncharacterized protein n=1 Tax=Acanthoscelides obtectus TaxID=200917 RepID=A0A9P0KGN9_ACAOB|nr:unnamed protein product [Acanthoscelides obtectus]CAK1681686.1 hypothetical protein AOBTE_LOCUS33214 [Acanthoscelides obtectus]
MGRVTKKVTRKHRKKLHKLLQLLDSSSESGVSSLESTGTDSDSDAPLSKHPTQVPEPGSSQDQAVQNILQFLGNQASAIKGPEVSTDVAALISEFLLKGIDKESRKTTLESYPCLANCSALQPPVINPEVRSCLSTNVVKEDTFLSKLQLQLASGISALAVGFDKQYEITKSQMFFTRFLFVVVIPFYHFWMATFANFLILAQLMNFYLEKHSRTNGNPQVKLND